jgi:hypothetical protein
MRKNTGGVYVAGWTRRLRCGCTAYLEQIRQTVDLLEEIDASQRVNPLSG